MISVDLFGIPVPQTRPRFFKKKGYMGVYDSQQKLKHGYQWQLKSQYTEAPLTIPLAMDIIFHMPIPNSISSIKKRQMANGIISHIKKPDIDNLQKFLLDCCNKILYEDDSQIVELRAKKIYSNNPGTLVRVFPLGDEKRNVLYENCSRNP